MTDKDKTVLFDKFYEQNGNRLKRFCFNFLSNHRESEDIMQVVFTHLYDNFHKYEGRNKAKLETWAFSVAKNKCLDCIKKFNITNKRFLLFDNFESFESFHHTQRDALDNVIEKEEKEVLYKEINRLNPKEKKVFIMVEIEGKNLKEVADKLKMSYDNSRCIISRTRKKLRLRFSSGC